MRTVRVEIPSAAAPIVIEQLDHIIVSEAGCYSCRDHGRFRWGRAAEGADWHEPGTLTRDMEKPARIPTAILMTAMLISGCSTPTDDVTGGTITQGPINFGTNDSTWANDGQCDDPRFEGPGTDDLLQTDDRGADANDCLSLYNAGEIRLAGIDPDTGAIDFGDNASEYARDGQCDDPRFTGPGTAWDWVLLMENRGHDGADCRTLYEAGEARLFGIAMPERRAPNARRQ